MSFRRLLLILVLLAGTIVIAQPVGAVDGPIELDREPTEAEWASGRVGCSLTVVGREKDGQLIAEPMRCWLEPSEKASAFTAGEDGLEMPLFAWGVIATHYDGYFSGSYIQIWGDVCNGGWLNLASNWINRISSTSSYCTALHYDGYGLTGQSEPQSYGALGALNNLTNSIMYT